MEPCPCGSEKAYADCCQPLISGERRAETAEALMRSRYAAHAKQAFDYIFDTTYPGSRQEDDLHIIEIRGHVNAASEPALINAFTTTDAARKTKLLLRFHQNTTINGAGLGVLIQLLSECRKNHQHVAIIGITESFAQIFDMVGITQLAAIAAGEQEAKALLNGEHK